MSDFSGMEDLLQDFLQEASDLLSDVDNKLVDLEKDPSDRRLLNDIFRGFHTIKGGAGFLNATELVTLCHLTENLFDKLRNGEMGLTPELMDTIMAATQSVRSMFGELSQGVQPRPAPGEVIQALRIALQEKTAGAPAAAAPGAAVAAAALAPAAPADSAPSAVASAPAAPSPQAPPPVPGADSGPDWQALHAAVTGQPAVTPAMPAATPAPDAAEAQEGGQLAAASGTEVAPDAGMTPRFPPEGRRATDKPGFVVSGATSGRRAEEKVSSRESTIRVDTARLDQVLNLSGEIGLTKNRLTSLRADVLAGRHDAETLHELDQAVSQLDLLVSDLQNSVMKTRMQPIGRLFQKYPRIARDLARQLGKDVELALVGEETEVDKTMIEDLADPLIHLVRNAVDHGVELPEERLAAGKPAKSIVRLEARQEGDHIVLIIADDGHGMSPEFIRARAVEKGLIREEEANTLDDRQSLNLIFLPGFSTMTQASAVSGRGVGMDVVKTNIQKLNGSIEIRSEPGKGTVFIISLPLTLAILQVLLVRLGDQPFALPLSMVREILPIEKEKMQEVGGRETLVVRGEVLPVLALSRLLGWPRVRTPEYGVLMQTSERSFILSVDSFAGRDDAVIKSLDDFRPRGVAGVTTLSNGQIVLILDMKELLADLNTVSHVDPGLGAKHPRAFEFSA
jgi:two-component system chemotaxis sensor kinase CheA